MEIEITKTEYQRVDKIIKVNLPEKQMYFWHNGIRRAYSIKPKWTTWNVEHHKKPEEIYEYEIVMVDPTDRKITLTKLSPHNLPDIQSNAKHPLNRLIDDMFEYASDSEYFRTREQFESDFNSVINELTAAI